MAIYICSAVVRDSLCSSNVEAVSEKQAWYKFSKKYGYKQRDFKILGVIEPKEIEVKQIIFNI